MRKGSSTRQSVLDEGAELASVVGIGGLTIGTLADRSGLSKSGLFAHFKSKEALQVAVLDHAIEQFVANVMAPALRAPRGESRLRDLFERQLAWNVDSRWSGGCVIVAALVEVDDQEGPARDRVVQCQRDWIDAIEQVVSGGIREGQFSPMTSGRQVAFEIIGISWSFHVHHRLLGEEAVGLAQTAFESLLDRLKS